MTLRSNVPLVFVDTETTSLNPHTRVAWEVGMIRVEPDGTTSRTDFMLDLTNRELQLANDESLEIGGYHERYNVLAAKSRRSAAALIAEFTDGAVFWANQPDFDAKGLADILESVGLKPKWDRRLRDINTFAIGILLGLGNDAVLDESGDVIFDESVHTIAEFLGVTVAESDKHTAMGDAQYVKDIYDELMILATSASR